MKFRIRRGTRILKAIVLVFTLEESLTRQGSLRNSIHWNHENAFDLIGSDSKD